MEEERVVYREDTQRVKDLLTLEEEVAFYKIKVRLLQADLRRDLPESEYDRLYKKAKKILLTAVDRELDARGLS